MDTRHGWAAVRRLQRGLRRAGYAPGPLDGRYGPLTAAAVERFQANHGLRVDGIVGPATRRALHALPTLALGAGEASAHGSPAVARLQRLLARAGFAPGPFDGRLGPRTEAAIVRFQRARHLAADGIAGSITERALLALGHVAATPKAPQGGRRPRPARSAPISQAPRPQSPPRRSPRAAQSPAPATPHLPMIWILIGLGILGLTALLTSYYQRPLTARAAQIRHKVQAFAMPHASADPSPEPPSIVFVIDEDNSGGYYWTIVTPSGRTLARSPRFASREEATRAAEAVHRGAGDALLDDRTGGPG